MLFRVTDGSGALLGKAFWPKLKSGNEQQDLELLRRGTPKSELKKVNYILILYELEYLFFNNFL